MKILIVGAGPAGLGLAALLKRSNPSHDVTVLERNPPDERPGWGITLRTNALSFLGLDRRIAPQSLEGRTLWYRGEPVVDLAYPAGVGNTAISRSALLEALLQCCSEEGVRVRFGVDGAQIVEEAIEEHDVVVAADGARSAVRQRFAEVFAPRLTPGRNRYAWLAAERPFHRLTAMLDDRDLPLLAWAYKHTEGLSTFIVEVTEATAESSGLLRLPPSEVCARVAQVFAEPLGGARVLSAGEARWHTFSRVTCERLWHRNVVLIGDAAHTTHFSQGYGTMFAFDDALALHDALLGAASVEEAFERYEASQKPKIAELQAASSASQQWAEDLADAASRRDEGQARSLIAARWRNNEVPPAPLESLSPPRPS